jgi:phosphoribosyl 1,2-cyclic phosphodiesterase
LASFPACDVLPHALSIPQQRVGTQRIVKLSLLASGSKGNALLIVSGHSRLLIDAGLSAREICRRLAIEGVAPEELTGIVVTHEHVDHVRGLGVLSRRFNLPIYLHHEIAAPIADLYRPVRVNEFETGNDLPVGEMVVRAFPVTHDAVATVGFTITGAAGKVGCATDLGIATRLVAEELRDCRCLVLESNHDDGMLRDGPYPWHLKQRIKSTHGHLSNHDSAALLESLCWPGLEAVCLAHLSDTNNLPQLAAAAAQDVLARQTGCQPRLLVGRQDAPISWTL